VTTTVLHVFHVRDHDRMRTQWWLCDSLGNRLLKIKTRTKQAAVKDWMTTYPAAQVVKLVSYRHVFRASEAVITIAGLSREGPATNVRSVDGETPVIDRDTKPSDGDG
jgi:hypothetical protein